MSSDAVLGCVFNNNNNKKKQKKTQYIYSKS